MYLLQMNPQFTKENSSEFLSMHLVKIHVVNAGYLPHVYLVSIALMPAVLAVEEAETSLFLRFTFPAMNPDSKARSAKELTALRPPAFWKTSSQKIPFHNTEPAINTDLCRILFHCFQNSCGLVEREPTL